MDVIKLLNTRYATKKFDATKKLSEENLQKVQSLLQLAPSSINSQPWHNEFSYILLIFLSHDENVFIFLLK